MGSGGYGIPSIVEPDIIQFKKHEADFILHVEKDTVWQRFNEDRFWEKNRCILDSRQRPAAARSTADAQSTARRTQAADLLPAR